MHSKQKLDSWLFRIMLIATVIYNGFSNAQGGKINFKEGRLDSLLMTITEKDKLVFIDCYTTWCGPCKAMNKHVFSVDTLAEYFNKNFICYKIDMEKTSWSKQIEAAYSVYEFPTYLFVDSKGNLVHKVVGYFDVDEFLVEAQLALSDSSGLFFLQGEYLKGNRESSFLRKLLLAQIHGRTLDYAIYRSYLSELSPEQLLTSGNMALIMKGLLWTDTNSLSLDDRATEVLLSKCDEFKKYFAADQVYARILMLASKKADSAISANDEILFDKAIKIISKFDDKGVLRYERLGGNLEGIIATDNLEQIKYMQFYSKKKDWINYDKYETVYINKNIKNPGALNWISANYCREFDDTAKLKKAVNWIKRALEISENTLFYFTYANILLKLGDYKEAKVNLEKSLRLVINEPDERQKQWTEIINELIKRTEAKQINIYK